jgi:hypothetical protein
MTVSVVMPYTSGCEWRARAREYVLGWYGREHPDWEVVEGGCGEPWRKGVAAADAVSRASGDVLVIADADLIADSLNDAAALVESGETRWVVPHHKVYRLHQRATERIYDGGPVRRTSTAHSPYVGVVGGGLVVVTRDAWETVGGIDPRFVGWGGEDISLGWALETLCGPCVRLTADLFHLYHPREPQGRRRRGGPESEALAGRYKDARGDAAAMRALVDEAKETQHGPFTTDDPAGDHHPASSC